MTRDDDIERVLDQWFTEGPTQMPTRFFNETFERLERVPKRHLSLGRPRISSAKRNVGLAAAAVVVVSVAAVGALLATHGSGIGVAPSPSPTPSASTTATIVDPRAIETKWTSIGERPAVGPGSDSTTSMSFILDTTSLAIDTLYHPADSAWMARPDNHLVLWTTSTDPNPHKPWTCEPGQEGTYAMALSDDASILTLAVEADACAARASILEGSWTRWPCPNPHSECGPELAPGHHSSAYQRHDDGNGGYGPPPFLSAFSYTVPAGWSGDHYGLGRRNDPGAMYVAPVLDVAPHSQDPTCPDAADPGAGRTVAAMADWLTRVPGLVTSAPAPIEIGGYQGLLIDVSVVEDWTTPKCQFADGKPIVMTFADPEPIPDGGPFVRESVEGESRARYILLDLGKGHNLLIEIKAPDKASWDDFVPAAMPVVESMQFTVAPGS